MKKILTVMLSAVIFVFLLVSIVSASEGYMVDSAGNPTNIKWTLDDEGLLSFEIDPDSSNAPSTVLSNIDPLTGDKGAWNKALPSFSGAKSIVIGDGITEIAGTFSKSSVKTVEIPESLVTLGKNAFASASALESIYLRGNEPEKGVADITKVTSVANNCFMSTKKLSTVRFNPDYKGALPSEIFKASGISALELPAGFSSLKNKSLSKSAALYTLTILGNDTFFESIDVFLDNEVFPRIKAKAGSKAESFAKENGFTFIDLDTGEETIGNRDAPTPKPEDKAFDPTGATGYGLISGQYYDTYWAFYSETKTLKFISNTSTKWNETGSFARGITDEAWKPYADQIEHVVIGPYINKLSQGALENLTKLKDVMLGPDLSQIDRAAFNGCTSLTSVWRSDKAPIEGRADLSKVKIVNSIFDGTGIKEVLLSKSTENIEVGLSFGIKTLLTPNITDALKEYCKNNGYNLQNSENPEELYEYWFYIPEDLPFCGARAVFDFDESTGTLTIYGSGVVDDIVNYYGGGSKTSPWFSIKQKIKHVVITERITTLGKYSFAQCKNLETVQIPDTDGFAILNAAFEKCYNLKSVYRAGTEPIEGTLDLSKIQSLESFTFESCYLIANVILNENVAEIGESVFAENPNLAAIYGTVGSYGETWAENNGKLFFDASASTPTPVSCTPPESTTAEESSVEDSVTRESAEVTEKAANEEETFPVFIFEINGTMDAEESKYLEEYEANIAKSQISVLPIGIAALVAVIAVVAVIIIIKARKKGK